jgi:transcriptional regulator with XRE-family HTH domain
LVGTAMDKTTLARRVKELRERAGLTQEEPAARAGLRRRAVADMESDRSWPAWPTMCALADALGVSLDDFRRQSSPGLRNTP